MCVYFTYYILYFCRPILIYVEWCTFAYSHVRQELGRIFVLFLAICVYRIFRHAVYCLNLAFVQQDFNKRNETTVLRGRWQKYTAHGRNLSHRHFVKIFRLFQNRRWLQLGFNFDSRALRNCSVGSRAADRRGTGSVLSSQTGFRSPIWKKTRNLTHLSTVEHLWWKILRYLY